MLPAALPPPCDPPEPPCARYVFTVADPAAGRVDARCTLSGLDGPLELALPDGVGFARLDAPRLAGEVHVSAVEAAGEEPVLERRSPWTWRLDPRGHAEVELAWSVPQDHRAQPAVVAARDEYEAPYLAADHGLLMMAALAIAPEELDLARSRVAFELPEGWPALAPWPETETNVFHPPSVEALQQDLVIVGDWDVTEQEAGGMRLTVAFAPGQELLRELVDARIGRIVEAELELFGTRPQERYLFVFGRPGRGSGFGGSPRIGSMTLFVSTDLPPAFAANGVTHLVAHEFHHTWMRARCRPPNELRFVTEGFTDWYAHVVPLRLGDTTPVGFEATLAGKLASAEEALRACGSSLVEAGGPAFFEGGAAYEAVYAGGLVVAALVDAALREADPERSLDELLRAFYEDPRWREGADPTLADFLALVEREAGEEVRTVVETLVTTAGPPDFPAAFAAVGIELQRTEAPPPLSMSAGLRGTRVLDLDPHGLAGRLGLRPGDRLIEVNGRQVADEGDVRAAWTRPADGRLLAVVLRAGEDEPRALELELAPVPRYAVPAGWGERVR